VEHVELHAQGVAEFRAERNVQHLVQQRAETIVAEALLNNIIGRSYLITTSFFLL
jgi:hypothetical protein